MNRSARVVAHNLQRIMAREGLSHADFVSLVGLDDRTLRGVLRGESKARPSTLNKIAKGIGVSVDTLFQPPIGMSAEAFDTATNPAVEHAIAKAPDVFEDWSSSDFAELASRFGVGGQLTEGGVLEAARTMNVRREVLVKARVVLESKHAGLLQGMIEVLYEHAAINS